jgi:hypothetical protein
MTAAAPGPGRESAPHAGETVGGHRDDRVRDSTELTVIPPAVDRGEVDSAGRVGAVAYPYRIVDARVEMERPFVSDRTDEFVASVDRSRRLTVRADTVPETTVRTVEDVLVLPAEVTTERADRMARKSVFRWTLRRYSLNEPPNIRFARTRDAYKLFWLAERPDGDVIVDSVRGEERPLRD